MYTYMYTYRYFGCQGPSGGYAIGTSTGLCF